jgi:hypothetical protein
LWSGSTTFANGNLSGVVQWVVNSPVSHNGKNQFEYTYQITPTGSLGVTQFSVFMLESNEAEDLDWFQIDGTDVAPTGGEIVSVPPSFNYGYWTFTGLTDGTVSYGLNYWSVNEPLDYGSELVNGGIAATNTVPSPSDVIPEPGALVVLAIGGVAVLIRRRRR